jgi:hypothetical protein
MKNLFYFIAIFWIAYSCSNDRNKNKTQLPDNQIANQVISTIIELDSFRSDHSLNKEFINIRFYNPGFIDSIVPPPPPDGLYYTHVLDIIKPQTKETRFSDSLFLSKQSSIYDHYIIADTILKKFQSSSHNVYQFYVPIFSSDLKTVMLRYWDYCGPLCGRMYTTVLHWDGAKWVLADKWLSGRS